MDTHPKLVQQWITELDARPRSAADLAFWNALRAHSTATRKWLRKLTNEYLEDLCNLTRNARLRMMLQREKIRRIKLGRARIFGGHGHLARVWRRMVRKR